MAKIIDIKMIEVYKINKEYRNLLDQKMKLEEIIAKLEAEACKRSLDLIEVKSKIVSLEKKVLKDIK
jgi:hypothetical protein